MGNLFCSERLPIFLAFALLYFSVNTAQTAFFFLACAAEIALMTAAHTCAGAYASPVLLLGAGVLVGWLPLQ